MKRRTAPKHRSRKWLVTLVTLLIAVVGIGSLSYASYYHKRFKPTTINGVSVTNLSVAQATQKLNQTSSSSRTTISLADTKVPVTQASVKRLLTRRNASHQSVKTVKLTLKQSISKTQQRYRLTTGLTQFKQKIAAINAHRTQPVNAKVVLKNGQLSIQSGHAGTALNETAMVAAYRKQVATAPEISVKKAVKATVSAKSQSLSTAKTKLKEVLGRSVTLKFPNKTVTYRASDYLKDGSMTASGTMSFDTSTLKQAITKLATQVDTKGKSGKFKTHSGATITVPSGGTWGWSISQSKLAKRILASFEGTQSTTINMADYVTGTGYGKSNTVGDTYIEVDLKHLREYAYVNGQLKFTTKVMSGTISGSDKTPQGFFYIMYKQRNTYLRGTNDDGSSYKSKVKYWMPITNDGVGLHDSSWQPSEVYGNVSYRHDYHSHGCINNPPSKMGALYDLAYAGEPVVIYD